MFELCLGMIFSAFCFLLYYGLLFVVLRDYGVIDNYRNLLLKEKILIVVILIAVTGYFYYLCSLDNRIVNWDSGFYWIKNLDFNKLLYTDPVRAFKQLYSSINFSDYSDVVPAIIGIPFAVFGKKSYDLYCMQNFIMFQIPAYLILTDVINRVIYRLGIRSVKYTYAGTIFFCVMVSYLYIPTIYGLYDIAGFTVVCTISLVLLEWDWRVFDGKRGAVLSILFLELLFIRRHFAFFALGYFVCYMFLQTFGIIKHKTYWGGYVKNTVVVGGICGGVLLLFFRDYLIRTLNNNYSVQYSARRDKGGIIGQYFTTLCWIGLFFVLISVIGIGILIMKKQYDMVFMQVVSTVFIMWLYFRIQNLSTQHYYNFAFQQMLLMCIGLFGVIYYLRKWKIVRLIMMFAEIAFTIICFAYALVPQTNFLNTLCLYPNVKYVPEKRQDMETLGRIIDEARELAQEYSSDVYCIASSGILNDDILRNYNLPEEMNAFPELLKSAHTDLADGFPVGFLTSHIIIATEPYQIHANQDGQRVVYFLDEMMISPGSVFCDNFKLVDAFLIDDEVKVLLYEKVKEFEDEDYDYLIDKYNEWYADYPELFEERIVKFRGEINDTDGE